MRVHVIPHDPFWLIPQKTQSRKDPSREARKFTGLENFVPILYCDSLLWARPAVQIHDCSMLSVCIGDAISLKKKLFFSKYQNTVVLKTEHKSIIILETFKGLLINF